MLTLTCTIDTEWQHKVLQEIICSVDFIESYNGSANGCSHSRERPQVRKVFLYLGNDIASMPNAVQIFKELLVCL